MQILPITPEEYFRRPELSNSGLTEIKKGLVGDYIRSSTKSFAFGSCVDAILTQSEHVSKYINEEWFGDAVKCARGVRDNAFYDIIKGWSNQVAIINTVEGIACRALFDKYDTHTGKFGADYKTTDKTDIQQFIKSVYTFDYDRQAYHYMSVGELDVFILYPVSKKNGKAFPFKVVRGDKTFNEGREKWLWLVEKGKVQ
jgi:hypothetical protein